MKIFKLPDLGEGLLDAEIVQWYVKVGEEVTVDQNLVSVETAKAIVELPSPFAGYITKLYGNPGDIIKTGEVLVEFKNEEGEKNESGEEREKETREDAGTVAGKLKVGNALITEPSLGVSSHPHHPHTNVKATPAVRALAQRLKVDLAQVVPSESNNIITLQDVQKAADDLKQAGPFEPLKGVRRMMAETMSRAHREVVPVTVMDDAKLLNWSPKEDISVHLIQAMVKACQKEPALNAWYDMNAMGRRMIKEVHIGIAMDTSDGLFVPVIRNAETLNSKQLRDKIELFKIQVRERTIGFEDLHGATITLSNFGKFAGRYANPMIVPPMVAILGAGKLRNEIVALNDQPVVCPVLPLSLTFDHRVVTGGEATRFLGVIMQELGNH